MKCQKIGDGHLRNVALIRCLLPAFLDTIFKNGGHFQAEIQNRCPTRKSVALN